jgi:hypothetical protein
MKSSPTAGVITMLPALSPTHSLSTCNSRHVGCRVEP